MAWANKLGMPKYDLKVQQKRCGEAPFDSGRKMMSTVHETAEGYVQYTKGAPDVIIQKCTHYLKDGKAIPMTEEYRNEILKANKAMADRALRVLACSEGSGLRCLPAVKRRIWSRIFASSVWAA